MECSKIEKAILDCLLEGRDPYNQPELTKHLKSCKICREVLGELNLIDQSIKGLQRDLRDESLPGNFAHNVYKKIRVKKQNRLRSIIYKSIAASVLIGIGILVFSQMAQDKVPPKIERVSQVTKNLLDGLIIPEENEQKFLLLSQVIGSEEFILSFDKEKGEFGFVSKEFPSRLANGWDQKLQEIIDRCFPETRILMCRLEKGVCKEFIVIN